MLRAETAAGWREYDMNPVLGGELDGFGRVDMIVNTPVKQTLTGENSAKAWM